MKNQDIRWIQRFQNYQKALVQYNEDTMEQIVTAILDAYVAEFGDLQAKLVQLS